MTAVTTQRSDPQSERGDYAPETLREMSPGELLAVFRKGRAPQTLEALAGDPPGFGVGMHVGQGNWLDRLLRRWSVKDSFPWAGKSFRSNGDDCGWGFNRVQRGPLLAVFPFKTSRGSSTIDASPCVIIDYDVRRNPRWARRTYDELREVAPGLFLGLVSYRWFGKRRLLLWFGVDCRP